MKRLIEAVFYRAVYSLERPLNDPIIEYPTIVIFDWKEFLLRELYQRWNFELLFVLFFLWYSYIDIDLKRETIKRIRWNIKMKNNTIITCAYQLWALLDAFILHFCTLMKRKTELKWIFMSVYSICIDKHFHLVLVLILIVYDKLCKEEKLLNFFFVWWRIAYLFGVTVKLPTIE